MTSFDCVPDLGVFTKVHKPYSGAYFRFSLFALSLVPCALPNQAMHTFLKYTVSKSHVYGILLLRKPGKTLTGIVPTIS